MLRPRVLPALAAIALVPALAACGGGDGGSSTTTPATSSPTTTASTATSTSTTASTTTTGTTTTTGAGASTSTRSAKANPLASYVRGGTTADGATADAVRSGLVAVGAALAKRDAKAACTRVAGAEAALRAGGLANVSCADALSQLAQAGSVPATISQANIAAVRRAQVRISGSKAVIELGGQPLPMLRQGGVWKVNVGAIFAAAKKARG